MEVSAACTSPIELLFAASTKVPKGYLGWVTGLHEVNLAREGGSEVPGGAATWPTQGIAHTDRREGWWVWAPALVEADSPSPRCAGPGSRVAVSCCLRVERVDEARARGGRPCHVMSCHVIFGPKIRC